MRLSFIYNTIQVVFQFGSKHAPLRLLSQDTLNMLENKLSRVVGAGCGGYVVGLRRLCGVVAEAMLGGWVAVLKENKTNSVFKLSLT